MTTVLSLLNLGCLISSGDEETIRRRTTSALGGKINYDEIKRHHELGEKHHILQNALGESYTVKAYRLAWTKVKINRTAVLFRYILNVCILHHVVY